MSAPVVPGVPAGWRVLGASVRGDQHRLQGLANQDAFGAWQQDAAPGHGAPVAAVAVADGHGHARGVRAARGARIAVESALSLVAGAAGVIARLEGAQAFLAELPTRLSATWNERVAAELRAEPFGERELARARAVEGASSLSVLEERPEVAYGTTLVVAVGTPEHVLLAQLGDGDVLVVGEQGRVSRPLARDPELVANRTWSLCQHDAPRRFKTLLAGAGPGTGLVLVATDGYSNSYRDASGFDQVGADMLVALREHGPDVLEANLPAWLSSTSEQGSGDDISVALLARTGS